ncbi:MAG: IS110 family transposase [Bacteroidetes bacterium]|nr:MAG: IS110 family transposase [Bacteroidota bacterium]
MKQQTSAAFETHLKDRDPNYFKGKVIYVGIDVHQKDYQVAKLCNGICLGNHRMRASASVLIEHLQKHYPGAEFSCVYESCAWGFNLQRSLTSVGMKCIVVHAADVSTTDKERKRKTDRVDALKLAQHLAGGELRAIHVPNETIQQHRNLIRYRSKLVGDINQSKNRVKSLLKYQGIEIPEPYMRNNWSRNFLEWMKQQAAVDELLADTLLLMIEQITQLRQLLLKVEAKLRSWRKGAYAAQAKLISSVPGVGPTTAMMFLLEVGDIHRFKSFDALNDFVGFCPDTNSSGQTDRVRGLTARRHKKLRSLLVEAAWEAIRIDPVILDSFDQWSKRMKRNQAIIRVARKLLRRMRAVMIQGQPYQKGVIQ